MFLSSTKIQRYRTDPLWKGLRRSGGQISCSNSSMWDETACSLVQSSCWWVFSKAGASAAFLNNCPNIWLISWGGGKFPNISSEFPVLQLLSVASHPWQLYSWGDSSSFFAKPPYQVTGNRNNPALLILKLKKPSLSASPCTAFASAFYLSWRPSTRSFPVCIWDESQTAHSNPDIALTVRSRGEESLLLTT